MEDKWKNAPKQRAHDCGYLIYPTPEMKRLDRRRERHTVRTVIKEFVGVRRDEEKCDTIDM